MRTLMQPGPQGSAAPKAALACFPPEIWPCSEYWDTMLQRRNPGLTSLSQPSSDLLSALDAAGEITAPIISSLERVSEQARVCASMFLATHLGEGRHVAMLNWACITYSKRIIYIFSLTFCFQ